MRFIFGFVLALILVQSVFASDFYADVVFDVHADGSVTIAGTTNHPLLQERTTQEFTSKNKQHWLLNITLPEQFSDYVFAVQLPPGATLTYAGGKNVNIGIEGKRVTIKGFGQDGTLSLTAQYTVAEPVKSYIIQIVASLLSAALISGFLVLAYYHGKRRQGKVAQEMRAANKKLHLIDGLPARQQEILTLLDKADGALTQKQIEKELGLPKASISRNIESLRRKDLLEKEQSGMSNIVRLKKN